MGLNHVDEDPSRNISAPEIESPSQFSIEVEIKGLPYILKGLVPTAPDPFELTVHLPNSVRENLSQQVVESARDRQLDNSSEPDESKVVEKFLKDGEIGSISLIDPFFSPSLADLYIDGVESDTWILPKTSLYHNAHGVGSSLMDAALTIADVRGWSVAADASPKWRSKLKKEEIEEWLSRKGFVKEKDSMIRYPKEPDLTQPILKVLHQEAPGV